MNKFNGRQESEVVENTSDLQSNSPRKFEDDVTQDNFQELPTQQYRNSK